MNAAVQKRRAPRPPTRRANFVDANFTHDIPDFSNDGCFEPGFLAGGLFASPSAGDGPPDTSGGPARHIPVLGRQAVDYLNVRDGGLIIDGTFGAGGYTRDILARANCRVIGIDRDPSAIAAGADHG